MKWFAIAIAAVIAIVVAVVLLQRDQEKNPVPPQRLTVAVPIEQAGHRAPTLVELWESENDEAPPTLRAFDERRDEPVWRSEMPHPVDWVAEAGQRPPFVRAGRVVVVPSRDRRGSAFLVAVELTTGQVAWVTPLTSRGWRWESVSAHGQLVVVLGTTVGDKTIAAAVSATDGSIVWQTTLAGKAHRVAYRDDYVVLAGTQGAIAVDAASDRRFELTREPGDLAFGGGHLLFVGSTINRIERRDGVVTLHPVEGQTFPAGAQPEVLAACAGHVVRVAGKGRGLIARPYAGKAAGWKVTMDKGYDVLHAGASMSRWRVLNGGWPEPRFIALWIDMGFRPQRGRLATVDCANGTLRWLSSPRSPTLVTPPRLIAGHYYVPMSPPGGGERAPAGFRYPPDPIAMVDGASGRLVSAVAVKNGQQQQEPIATVVPWRVRDGFLFQDTATQAPWSVSPRDCRMGPSRESRTCVSVLPMVHELLGRPPPPAPQ